MEDGFNSYNYYVKNWKFWKFHGKKAPGLFLYGIKLLVIAVAKDFLTSEEKSFRVNFEDKSYMYIFIVKNIQK